MGLKTKILIFALAASMVVCTSPVFAADETSTATETAQANISNAANDPKQMENINRGGFAADIGAYSQGVYLSWRLLGTEPMDTVFNIYKNGTLLVENLNNTSYTDAAGTANDNYTVATVINGTIGAQSETFMKLTGHRDSAFKSSPYAYFDVPINIPEGGSGYNYNPEKPADNAGGANDASVGDVDGDGEYEIILKWDPSNSKDSAGSGVTGNVYIDCYEFDGTQLWRIDLGRNIRAGAHYTQFQVYDYDGDGKAELAVKTAPGSIDGKGNYVSDAGNTAEIRNTDNTKTYLGGNGHITGGPEYLTIFNGETGVAMQTIDYDPPVGSSGSWGDSNYNRSDRFLAGTAYLDGVHPSMIFCRGYYAKSVAVAYDWDGTNLTKRWKLDSSASGNSDFAAQGHHQLSVADLDNDGKDEIIYGGAAIDDDGSLMWSVYYKGNKLGHGDALHVSDFDDDGEQEIFKVSEDHPNWGRTYINGSDGAIIWHDTATGDDGRGAMANFSKKYGVLAWDSGIGICGLNHNVISKVTTQDNKWSYPNFPIYWDGDLQREHFDGNRISKWNDYDEADANGNLGAFGRLWNIPGTSYNNTSKKNPCLQADLFGDWREELILRRSDNAALRVFTSLSPTDYKFTTFMHDSQYRCAIAWQNTGYNQPPHQSYYIGDNKDLSAYTQPNITVKELNPEIKFSVKTSDGEPVEGVNVTLGGIEKPTDVDGNVYFIVPAGSYSYIIDQTGYLQASGTIELLQNETSTEKSIIIEPVPDSVITVVSDGVPVKDAKLVTDGQTVTTDSEGKAVIKLRAGQYDYTVSCHKFITKSGKFTVPESNSFTETIELEAISYVYDSSKDAEGTQFTYSGDTGAELAFSNGQWTLAQNSTDGGRKFDAVFDTSANGNVELEMIYKNGAQKDSNDKWDWTGREYTHVIELRDINGNVIAGLCQPYKSSGVQELQYYTASVDKTNVSSGTLIGGGSITKRSSVTWKLKFNIDLKAKTVNITVTDEAGENGYILSGVKMDSTNFSSISIGTEATGNVTCAPAVSKVLYWSDCIDTTVVPTSPTPAPTEIPMSYETWDFDDLTAGSVYGTDNKTISNQNGNEITINYGTSSVTYAVPPTITERISGNNYLRFDDKGTGQDGWSYKPAQAIDSETIVIETDFMLGDTAKDAQLLRVSDTNNANTDNTYTTSTDGRSFEIKTGDNGTLKFTDYFSEGSGSTDQKPKGLDSDVKGFTFAANRWYSIKLVYTKADNKVEVYTRSSTSSYTKNNTFTLGSGTTKGSVPQLSPTGIMSSTRGSSAAVLGIDNIKIGVAAEDKPISEYTYKINSVQPSVSGVNVNIAKNSETTDINQVIVAAYDKDTGILKNIGFSDIEATAGETKDVYVEIGYDESDLIIAYVWKSMSDIVPLSTVFEVK